MCQNLLQYNYHEWNYSKYTDLEIFPVVVKIIPMLCLNDNTTLILCNNINEDPP